jgi:predicted SprT family Zn-dependent metalloprotease
MLLVGGDTTNENIRKQHYKCSGKGCQNAPTTLLKINYINKVGYFCDSCTHDLLHGELAVKIGDI